MRFRFDVFMKIVFFVDNIVNASPCFIENKAINSNKRRFSRTNLRLNSKSTTLITEERNVARFAFCTSRRPRLPSVRFFVMHAGTLGK